MDSYMVIYKREYILLNLLGFRIVHIQIMFVICTKLFIALSKLPEHGVWNTAPISSL